MAIISGQSNYCFVFICFLLKCFSHITLIIKKSGDIYCKSKEQLFMLSKRFVSFYSEYVTCLQGKEESIIQKNILCPSRQKQQPLDVPLKDYMDG